MAKRVDSSALVFAVIAFAIASGCAKRRTCEGLAPIVARLDAIASVDAGAEDEEADVANEKEAAAVADETIAAIDKSEVKDPSFASLRAAALKLGASAKELVASANEFKKLDAAVLAQASGSDKVLGAEAAGEKVAVRCTRKLDGCAALLDALKGFEAPKLAPNDLKELAAKVDAVTTSDAELKNEKDALAKAIREEAGSLEALRDLKQAYATGLEKRGQLLATYLAARTEAKNASSSVGAACR